ncbi:MAG: transcriptional repressor [Deltaproteobacteria bacterium]|nr:transcriptional repressor [Deltaproteobacteria bacterium]
MTSARAAALRDRLRGAGLRATPARLAVLEVLETSEHSLSHAELVALLQAGPWDATTLYRNLTDIVRVGLARRVDMGDHVWRYQRLDAAHQGDHPHFTCVQCGETQCLPGLQWTAAQQAPKAVARMEVDVQLRGVCDDCQATCK